MEHYLYIDSHSEKHSLGSATSIDDAVFTVQLAEPIHNVTSIRIEQLIIPSYFYNITNQQISLDLRQMGVSLFTIRVEDQIVLTDTQSRNMLIEIKDKLNNLHPDLTCHYIYINDTSADKSTMKATTSFSFTLIPSDDTFYSRIDWKADPMILYTETPLSITTIGSYTSLNLQSNTGSTYNNNDLQFVLKREDPENNSIDKYIVENRSRNIDISNPFEVIFQISEAHNNTNDSRLALGVKQPSDVDINFKSFITYESSGVGNDIVYIGNQTGIPLSPLDNTITQRERLVTSSNGQYIGMQRTNVSSFDGEIYSTVPWDGDGVYFYVQDGSNAVLVDTLHTQTSNTLIPGTSGSTVDLISINEETQAIELHSQSPDTIMVIVEDRNRIYQFIKDDYSQNTFKVTYEIEALPNNQPFNYGVNVGFKPNEGHTIDNPYTGDSIAILINQGFRINSTDGWFKSDTLYREGYPNISINIFFGDGELSRYLLSSTGFLIAVEVSGGYAGWKDNDAFREYSPADISIDNDIVTYTNPIDGTQTIIKPLEKINLLRFPSKVMIEYKQTGIDQGMIRFRIKSQMYEGGELNDHVYFNNDGMVTTPWIAVTPQQNSLIPYLADTNPTPSSVSIREIRAGLDWNNNDNFIEYDPSEIEIYTDSDGLVKTKHIDAFNIEREVILLNKFNILRFKCHRLRLQYTSNPNICSFHIDSEMNRGMMLNQNISFNNNPGEYTFPMLFLIPDNSMFIGHMHPFIGSNSFHGVNANISEIRPEFTLNLDKTIGLSTIKSILGFNDEQAKVNIVFQTMPNHISPTTYTSHVIIEGAHIPDLSSINYGYIVTPKIATDGSLTTKKPIFNPLNYNILARFPINQSSNIEVYNRDWFTLQRLEITQLNELQFRLFAESGEFLPTSSGNISMILIVNTE